MATILAIDDVLRNLVILKNGLEDEGHQVLMAENGLQGLEIIESHDPDLVLLDISMPGMDGHEVLCRLRDSEAYKELPIILLTTDTTDHNLARCLAAGANDYVTKPFSLTALSARINEALRASRHRQPLETPDLRRVNGTGTTGPSADVVTAPDKGSEKPLPEREGRVRTGSHTAGDCKYHVVWVTRLRCQVLGGDVGLRCRELLREIAHSKEMIVYAGSINRDHVHMLIGIPPQLSVSRAVKYLKRKTSRELLAEFGSLRKRYWGQQIWARGYWVSTSGDVTDEVWKRYIEAQSPPKPDDDFRVL